MKELAVAKYMSAFNKENIQIERKNDIALFASEKPKIVSLNLLQKLYMKLLVVEIKEHFSWTLSQLFCS